MPPRLILASSSRYRRALLERLGVPFEAISPDIDESPLPNETPIQLVERLAIAKARAIAQRMPNSLVVGSDQVAVHGGTIVGKPHTFDNAVAQLRQASGSTVTLHTGLALVHADSGRVQSETIPFRVVFRNLSQTQIENYLNKERPFDCAGSVKSEGLGIALLERFEGDDPNALIGLPLIRLVRMLEREGLAVI